jgi:transporter family-2 protein
VLGQERGALGRRAAGSIALALCAGAVLPVQGAVNALLRQDLGAAFAVALVSFAVAALTMAAALALTLARRDAPRPRLHDLPGMPWWAWLGGFSGATYVITMFLAMPAIGAAPTVGLTVAGQQIASLFVDARGWFRLPQRPVSRTRLAGVAVLLAGVAVVATAT